MAFGCLAAATLAHAADLSSVVRAGLGWTSNASLSSTDPDADALLGVSGRVGWRPAGAYLWAFNLGYSNHFSADANDSLTLSASGTWNPDLRKPLKVFGIASIQEYPNGDPAITDVSFSSRGLQLGFEDLRPLGSGGDLLTYQGSFQFRHYSGVNRADYTFSGWAFWERELTAGRVIEAGLELGLVPSSDSDFSRAYLEVSASFEATLNPKWKILPMLSYRATGFTSRLTSATTLVTRRRGSRTTSTTVEEKESYRTLHLSAEAVYALSSSMQLSVVPSVLSQGSRSGSQDYSAVELSTRFSVTF